MIRVLFKLLVFVVKTQSCYAWRLEGENRNPMIFDDLELRIEVEKQWSGNFAHGW